MSLLLSWDVEEIFHKCNSFLMLDLYKLDLSSHQTQTIALARFAFMTIFIQKKITLSTYTSTLQSDCGCHAKQRQMETHILHS